MLHFWSKNITNPSSICPTVFAFASFEPSVGKPYRDDKATLRNRTIPRGDSNLPIQSSTTTSPAILPCWMRFTIIFSFCAISVIKLSSIAVLSQQRIIRLFTIKHPCMSFWRVCMDAIKSKNFSSDWRSNVLDLPRSLTVSWLCYESFTTKIS